VHYRSAERLADVLPLLTDSVQVAEDAAPRAPLILDEVL
jgi:hypothetical protein